MVCIYCGSPTSVTNSRRQKRQNAVWRRRHCATCDAIFTTIENIDFPTSVGVAQGSHIVPFSRDQLFIAIYESCKHRKSAIYDAAALTDTVCTQVLQTLTNGTLNKDALARLVYDVLTRFDTVAATMYRAYHDVPA